MADDTSSGLTLLPDDMLRFVLDSSHNLIHAPRLSQLLSHGRPPVHTPHYVAATSRGVIPHLSHDVLRKHTDVNAVYMGLEDFIEKSCRDAPVLKTPTESGESTLRKFTALPSQCLAILGARRVPRVQTSAQNSDASIAICTSVGFRTLELSDYVEATSTLRPEVSTALPDLPSGEKTSKRRAEKMADRSQAWLRYTLSSAHPPSTPTFASIPPLEAEEQQLYLSDLAADHLDSISGLSIYDPASSLVVLRQLSHLPLLCISDPPTPHALLHAISLGIDLITVPFVTATSEQGIALTFSFPPPQPSSEAPTHHSHPDTPKKHPLGIDLFSASQSHSHSTFLSPLFPFCTCYTCTRHHTAYIQHLLSTREMLAWTLLQIHNFHVLSCFFEGVRGSIQQGTFRADRQAFEAYYSTDLGLGVGMGQTPETETGAVESVEDGDNTSIENIRSQTTSTSTSAMDRGPRLRGYQRKSVGKGEDKKREKVWGRFGGRNSPKSKSDSHGTGTPAEFNTGVENDQAMKIKEAKEEGTADLELTACDFDTLGLAEKEENVKQQ